MTTTPNFTDLNEAFGKALLTQFFEPVIVGRGSNGEPFYQQSGVSLLAQAISSQYADQIKAELWSQIDMDDFAQKIADRLVADLTAKPGYGQPVSPEMRTLTQRVMEIVAQTLGQRVVDQMDLHLSSRPQVEQHPTPKESNDE